MFASALGKARSSSKDGNETNYETREDELQGQKYQEIIDLLIACGYFRARIKGLSNFDKVFSSFCIFLYLTVLIIKLLLVLIFLLKKKLYHIVCIFFKHNYKNK